VSFLL